MARCLGSGVSTKLSAARSRLNSRWLPLLTFLVLTLFSTGNALADSLTLMSGAGQTGLGGSTSAQPIVVQVRNAAGAVASGRTIYWSSNNGFVLSAASSVTDTSGLASVNFTYGSYGTSSIFASDPIGSTSARALATSTGTDSLVLVSGGGQSGKTGSASTLPLVVELRNAAGSPISGRTVFWNDQTTYTRVNSLSSVTNAQGRASMGFTYLIGPVEVEGAHGVIRARNSAGAQYADATMRVLGVNLPRIISGEYQSGLIGATGTIVGQVTDPNGTPIANLRVFWRDDSGIGRITLSSNSTVTDATGKTSITFQYVLRGQGTITMDLGAVPDTEPSASVYFNSINAGSLTLISPNGMTGVAGSVSPVPIVVEVRDAQGQLAAGRTITWTVGAGNSTPASASSVTDTGGRASTGFTFGSVGGNIIATDTLTSFFRGQRLDPSPMNTMRVVSGSAQVGPSNSVAPQPVVVELLNSSGSPIAGRTINWSLNALDGGSVALAGTSSVTDASGRASMSFTFLIPGRVQIMAQDSVGGRSTFFPQTTTGIDSLVVVSGDNQSGLPGTNSTQPLVVELRNNVGQPIAGRTINWEVNAGAAILDAPTRVTDAAGRASMGFRYSATPSFNIIGAHDTASNAEVTFLTTAVGSNSMILVSGNGQSGQQGAPGTQPLVVEVRDGSGQPVAGRSIAWGTLSGNASTASNSSLTDSSGRASMAFTHGAGASTLAATDSFNGQQIRFNVNAVSAAGSGRIASGDGQAGTVGSAGAQPIIIELRDGNNAPWAARSITWSVVSGAATLVTSGSTTDASGQASATFNFGPSAGSSVIQAVDSASGMLLQAAVTTLAAAGAPRPDTMTVMSGAGQSGLGGSPGSQPIVIELRNVDGVAVAGRTINWSAGNGIVLQSPTSVTDASGRASMTFTYGNSGPATILASESVSGANARALLTSTGSDSVSLISGGGQAGRAGSTATQPIVVELRNAAGTPIAGRTLTWTDETALTRVAASSSVTDVSGRASMGFTFLQSQELLAGGATATIRATNPSDSQFVEASATVLGVDIVKIISGQSQSGLIGSSGTPIVALVTDWNGTPIPGVTVTWREDSGMGLITLASASSVTDAAGKASVAFQYVKPGTGNIVAELPNGFQQDVHFVSVGSQRMNLVTPTNLFGSPGQVSPVPVTIEMVDVNNNPLPGRTINWSTIDGDAVVAGATSVTDAAGRASIGFTYGSLASTIAAIDLQAYNVDPRNFNFAASRDTFVSPTGSGVSFQLISGNGQLGLAGTAGAQPIVVELRNASGGPIVGASIRWGAFGTARVSSPTSLTDASGRASMTFTYGGPGQTLIQVVSPGATLTAGYIQLFVAATGVDSFSVISGDGQSGLVGSHSAQALVAELRDASGQPIVGRAITWISNHGDVTFDSTVSLSDAAGRVSMGFTYGPSASVFGMEARDLSTNIATQFLGTAVGANAINLISGNGQTGGQNTAGLQALVVEVRDALGNPVAGRSISWSTIAGDALPSAPSSLTDASGRASMAFTHGTGTSTVSATDTVSAQQVRFTVTGTQAGRTVQFVSGGGQSGLPGTAGSQPIVVELRDAANAPLSGQAITWTVLSGPATLVSAANVTDASGRASATFNFGATAGSSVIQIRDSASGQLVQVSVTARGNNQTLALVSGDGQTLVANVISAPLVVQLKDFSNAPVAGATINWTASSGTLANASTVTDANGQSSNTVTAAQEGSVTVTANSPLAGSAITFTLTAGLATLPNLTPQQASVATAVDVLCPALASKPSLTPQEADLLARCQELAAAALANPGATANALQELLSDTAQAQSNAATAAVNAQFQNINTRLMTLRTGAAPVSLSGLSFTGSGGVIPLASLMSALAGDEKSPQQQPTFGRWGFFASGNIGRGEAEAGRSSPAYDYDIEGLTVGLDYRQRDNWIFGAALGYSRQNTDLAGQQGDIAMNGWSVSSYSTYSFKELWYVDGVITYGRNRYELNRRIAYTLPTPGGGSTSINQVATGKPDGDLFSMALTFGGDFHKQAWGLSPYGQLLYSQTGFDRYAESLQTGPGSGLGLAVESRKVTALTGILGSRFTYTHSADWGVAVPTASLEWSHEFKGDLEAISASFIYDPTHTLFSVSGEPTDTDYLRLSLGLSLVLAHGRSGFFQYQWVAARNGQSQSNLSLGIRVEF